MHRFSPELTARHARDPQRVVVPWRNPAQAYGDFLAAVAKRDVDAVLARMTDNYARGLSHGRARREFPRDFAHWCDKYPRELKVVRCCIDGDTATLETSGQGDTLAGHVTMVLNGGMWCVGAERWHGHEASVQERSHV